MSFKWAASACIVAQLLVTGSTPVEANSKEAAFRDELKGGLEEVYVFRTTRTQRTRGATPQCAAAGFESTAEDFYELWSMELVGKSSRVTAAHLQRVGEFRACFGKAEAGKPFSMYATGTIASIAWNGMGECAPMIAQPPERTVRAFNCNLSIGGLPDFYAGGWLTSSTLAPVLGAGAPPDAHVPGYLSTSVVTMRLWKRSGDGAKRDAVFRE